MARGESGRIVIEVDPDLKGELYTALTYQGLTLKAWFVKEAQRHIRTHKQPYLFATEAAGLDPVTAAEREEPL